MNKKIETIKVSDKALAAMALAVCIVVGAIGIACSSCSESSQGALYGDADARSAQAQSVESDVYDESFNPADGTVATVWFDGDFSYEKSGNEAKIINYMGDNLDVTVPHDIGGLTVTSVVLVDCKITSLDVSAATDMTQLICDYNQLSELDISKNTKLTQLYCQGNKLSKIDVSENKDIVKIHCGMNELTSLDVSGLTKLNYLHAGYNKLTKIDVSKNTKLEQLNVAGNKLKKIDVSKNGAIKYLHCADNKIKKVDISKLSGLKYLYVDKSVSNYKALSDWALSTGATLGTA